MLHVYVYTHVYACRCIHPCIMKANLEMGKNSEQILPPKMYRYQISFMKKRHVFRK